jgi:hypothetical protein
MRAAGVPAYNGAHLRLEKDAIDWARILGGRKKYLGLHAKAFAAAGFGPSQDLYVASGLLTYNASAEMRDMLRFLQPHSKSVQVRCLAAAAAAAGEAQAARAAPLPLSPSAAVPSKALTAARPPSPPDRRPRPAPAPATQYKELYLPPETLKSLNPEQEALVDFLVLSNANNFVGLGSSTFSVYLRWGLRGGRCSVESRALRRASGCRRPRARGTLTRLSIAPPPPPRSRPPPSRAQGVPRAAGPPAPRRRVCGHLEDRHRRAVRALHALRAASDADAARGGAAAAAAARRGVTGRAHGRGRRRRVRALGAPPRAPPLRETDTPE